MSENLETMKRVVDMLIERKVFTRDELIDLIETMITEDEIKEANDS
tara:strand:- start:39 stop:176 length:138 start_codon:yes stop_codon:yes gene_type:complete